jgi:hypothetical protein
MHSAPFFFKNSGSNLDAAVTVSMPHALNAVAALYPRDAIKSMLSTADIAECGSVAAPSKFEVGSSVEVKCPGTRGMRFARVVQASNHVVKVRFNGPGGSCASIPEKFVRPVKNVAEVSLSKHEAAAKQAAGTALRSLSDDDIASLCALSLIPSIFDEQNFRPLFTVIVKACQGGPCEHRALLAIVSLVSTPAFVAHMSRINSDWIAELVPVAATLKLSNDFSNQSYRDVVQAAVVTVFNALLRSAASATQRQTIINIFVRSGIIHTIFRFCQTRDAPNDARDSAASVVLSCAAVNPSRSAVSWLKMSYREPRRSSISNVLQDISAAWAAAQIALDDDFSDNKCVLSVERFNLVASSVRSFGFCTLQGLAKKLKVSFVLERGCDAGGLTVEWLHLILDTLFSDFSFFLPVLLPNGRPSGVVRINHSANMATSLPFLEVFRMVGCCLALCLQVISSAPAS